MIRSFHLTLLAGSLAFTAQAQVYQWKDPDSGAKRFSNTAPSWYRHRNGEANGPRVQVFYYSTLVDDTSLPHEVRQAMRAQSAIGRYLPPLNPPVSQQARR